MLRIEAATMTGTSGVVMGLDRVKMLGKRLERGVPSADSSRVEISHQQTVGLPQSI
jgi:hypothetical protein